MPSIKMRTYLIPRSARCCCSSGVYGDPFGKIPRRRMLGRSFRLKRDENIKRTRTGYPDLLDAAVPQVYMGTRWGTHLGEEGSSRCYKDDISTSLTHKVQGRRAYFGTAATAQTSTKKVSVKEKRISSGLKK